MNFAKSIAASVAAIVATGCNQGCTAVRTVVHNFADLDDHAIFANRVVESAPQADPLRRLARVPAFMSGLQVPDEAGAPRPLDTYLEETRTAAFVVIRDDRIVYERYGRGYGPRSKLNSFSIAKAIMATLVGIAIAEGQLSGVDATVADYRPDLAATPYGPVRVRELLAMRSGVGDARSLLPGRAQYYYGDDLRAAIVEGTVEARPGERWRYSEADVQVLGVVLAAATGRSVSAYLAEKIWKPLGMESEGLWALDRENGVEKAFCCISARARDFARFGRLFLNGGRVGEKQVVPREWANPAAFPGFQTRDRYTHRNLWWFPEGVEGDYYAYGHNGQYVYVNPVARTVIVKFSEDGRHDPLRMFRVVSAVLKPAWRAAELDRLAVAQAGRR